jgi:predicted PolB exonuclease-like 3'-5' exonuclease
MIIAFDIETIPDTEALKYLLPDRDEGLSLMSELEKKEEMGRYHLEITEGRNAFPRQLFHKIACVGAVFADVQTDDGSEGVRHNVFKKGYRIVRIKTVGRSASDDVAKFMDEEKIVSSFCGGVNSPNSSNVMPRLVTFNGRGFDIPVIKYRAMKYGIDCSRLMSKEYSYRYGVDYNIDLLEVFSDFGASARIKMSEICSILRIPCKLGMDGSDVFAKYQEGRVFEVESYCKIDALITFVLYLRYQVILGKLSHEGYDATVERIFAHVYAMDLQEGKPLLDFCEKWQSWGAFLGSEKKVCN